MKDNYEVLRELRVELHNLELKIEKLTNFRYGNTIEYLKLGSEMCCLIDIQEHAMKAYREVLIARIVCLEKKITGE